MSSDQAIEGDPARPSGEGLDDHEQGVFGVTGDQINWDSHRVNIRLGVELPFWLLVPNGSLAVTVEGCTLQGRIVNQGVEVTSGSQTTRSHEKTIYIGDAEEGKSVRIPIPSALEGGSAQFIRTYAGVYILPPPEPAVPTSDPSDDQPGPQTGVPIKYAHQMMPMDQ
jgi:hypothetical protein